MCSTHAACVGTWGLFVHPVQDQAVMAGTVIFVEANLEHRFYDIMEELLVLVFFAPAEST